MPFLLVRVGELNYTKMYYSEHRPDCRIFIRRLITPDPEINKAIPVGGDPWPFVSNPNQAFKNYYPKQYRQNLVDKYTKQNKAWLDGLSEQIKSGQMDVDDASTAVEIFKSQVNLIESRVDKAAVANSKVWLKTLQGQLNGINVSLQEARTSQNQDNIVLYEQQQEDVLAQIAETNTDIEVRSRSLELKTANAKLTETESTLIATNSTLKRNQKRFSTINAVYDPILLEVTMGITSVTTTIARNSMGSATIVIKVPLEENGFFENILTAVGPDLSATIFSAVTVDAMRKTTGISSNELSVFKQFRNTDGSSWFTDKRECSLQPEDMVQIYFVKRYSSENTSFDPAQVQTVTSLSKGTLSKQTVGIPKFPNDYVPGFTGFIKNTSVNFTGGQTPSYTVTITLEDVGHILRISRANLDPASNPTYVPDGVTISAFPKLSQPGDQNKSGGELIEDLIRGKKGDWLGVSQIIFTDDGVYDPEHNQWAITYKDETQSGAAGSPVRSTSAIQMPWEFDKIPLNTYNDFITNSLAWNPYVAAFKSSFRLWESDYKYIWDIAKEISEIMEFEFYADNFGCLNYHPPLYNINPINPITFIEDKEILSESHNFNSENVVTACEIVSQPNLNAVANFVGNLSSFATAEVEMIQRYGARFRSKNIPVLSGTRPEEKIDPTKSNELRYLFARAWLNRRNLEVRSATVDIPGTPELFLCNSIAFVGNFIDLLSLFTLTPTASPAARVTAAQQDRIKTYVNNIKVYYITSITHKYTQGGSFVTTLNLTHGRLWGDHYNVGYAFTDDQNDQLVEDLKHNYLKRKEDDIKTFGTSFTGGLSYPFKLPALNAIANTQDKTTMSQFMNPLKL